MQNVNSALSLLFYKKYLEIVKSVLINFFTSALNSHVLSIKNIHIFSLDKIMISEASAEVLRDMH